MYIRINNAGKAFQTKTEIIRNENDNLITDFGGILNIRKEYFAQHIKLTF